MLLAQKVIILRSGDAGKRQASESHINKHLICCYVLVPLKWRKEKVGRKDKIMELVCLPLTRETAYCGSCQASEFSCLFVSLFQGRV